jgi:hypothetical protein
MPPEQFRSVSIRRRLQSTEAIRWSAPAESKVSIHPIEAGLTKSKQPLQKKRALVEQMQIL